MIKIIDWYIIKKYLGTFFFTIAIFTVIMVVFDISERMDDFLLRKPTLNQIIFDYYAGFIPFYLNYLFPLINFIAVIFFTARMADQTEIVPILTGLVSFRRFLRPYFIGATVIFLIALVFNIYIIPQTNKKKNAFENVYVSPQEDNLHLATHIQIDSNTYVYVDNFDNRNKIGYKFVLEEMNGDVHSQKMIADRVAWDSTKHTWSILDYSIRDINGLKENLHYGARKDTILDMRPADFEIYDNIYLAMTMPEINDRIKKEKMRGTGKMVYLELEKYKRFATPLSVYILTLMGVSLSSRKVRGGIGASLGIGILLSFAYIVALQFTTMFALKGGLPAIIAVMIPNGLFGVIAVYLMIKAPK